MIDRFRAWRGGRPAHLSFAAAVGCAGLFFVVAGPWWLRQLAVFGSISPTASTGNALWLTDYRQWNSITADASLGAFLDQGIGGIVASRMVGLIGSVANFVVVVGGVILIPFMAIGAWQRRHSDDFLPWFLYFGVLVAGATLLFPLHVPGGAFIHSAIGLAPQGYILALEGVALGVGWIARRRPSWDPKTAVPLFSWVLVVLVVIGGLLYAPVVQAGWNHTRVPRQELAAQLQGLGVAPDDRILSIDAAGIKYWTGHPGVVTPDDPIDTIKAVADAYDIRWLVLERDGTVEALKPVLTDDQRPPWIGPAAFTIAAPDGGVPLLALYPVCAGDGPQTACAS